MIETDVPFYHIDIPRTASRSIREALGIKDRFWMHLSAQQKKERVDDWGDAWVFTVVRNPYSKVVSQFKHRQVFHEMDLTAENFTEWVTRRYEMDERPRKPDTDYFDRLWWPQHKFLTDDDGEPYPVTVFRFEYLPRAWEQVQERLGIDVDLPHENAAEDRTPWYEFYGEGAAPIIKEHFALDFQHFAYSWTRPIDFQIQSPAKFEKDTN